MPVARHDLYSITTQHQRYVVIAESLGSMAESSRKLIARSVIWISRDFDPQRACWSPGASPGNERNKP
jgi:hypothetical protein